jgi:hypothetical protein
MHNVRNLFVLIKSARINRPCFSSNVLSRLYLRTLRIRRIPPFYLGEKGLVPFVIGIHRELLLRPGKLESPKETFSLAIVGVTTLFFARSLETAQRRYRPS